MAVNDCYVSGSALAAGDVRHKGWKTPAASAVPLTGESLIPRHRVYPGDLQAFALRTAHTKWEPKWCKSLFPPG